MSTLDPLEPISSDSPTPYGSPGDEDIASDLVDIGRRIADGETRDAVTQHYVDEANSGEDTDEALEDIARSESVEDLADEVEPEVHAIHPEMPSDEGSLPSTNREIPPPWKKHSK